MAKHPLKGSRTPRNLVDRLTTLEEAAAGLRKDLDIQFRRIAQLQAQFDQIQAAWTALKKR